MIAKDSSNNNFQLKIFGNTQISTSVKKFGTGSVYFDGNGDYLALPTSSAFQFSNDFTVEFWLHPLSFTTNMCLFDSLVLNGVGARSDAIVFLTNTSGLYYLFTGGSIIGTSSSGPTLNQWNHVALVRSGSAIKVYNNGNEVLSVNNSTNFSSGGCVIGSISDVPGNPSYALNGYIDDLRITKGIARYTSNFTPPIAELVDPFDPYIDNVSLLLHGDGSDNSLIITDSSNNNFALTLNGNVKISQVEKKFGTGSIAFDGSGDYIDIPYNTDLDYGLGDFTVEFWVRFNTVSNYADGLVCSTVNGAMDIQRTTDGGGSLGIGNHFVSWEHLFPWSPSTGIWYHVAICRASGQTRAFIDGQQIGTTKNDSAKNYSMLGGSMRIGKGDNDLNGYIDDLRITKGVARYISNFIPATAPFSNRIVFDTVPTAGLVARFMADQGITESGGIITSWTDQSGNNIIATPFGNPARIANQMNGRPAVSFNDTQYFSFNLNFTITGPRTYIIIGRYRNPAETSQQGFLGAGYDASYDLGYVFKNSNEDRAYFYNGAQIRSPNITLTKYHVATVVHNGINGYNIYRMNGNNSTEISYGNMGLGSNVNEFVIGGRQPGEELLRGEIVEILIYNRQLSMIEIEQIENYAKV